MNAISNLGLLASLIFPAATSSANEGRTATLAQALETFNAVDSNKDGKLSPEEVAVFQLGRSETRGVDVDRDEFWSKDEFIVFYRQRLLAADVKPAADLEAEATRILAARKAKASERNSQPSLSEARRTAKQAQAQDQSPSALTDAVDALQVKASAGQAKGPDFDRVRELLLADARAADSAAKGEDAALGEKSDLHSKLLQSLERLRNAAGAGTFSREEYQDFRQSIVKRARNAANGAAAGQGNPASPDVQAIEQGLNEALDRLEQRATAGNATREDFDRVRDQLVARARAAANGANGPGAVEVELQGPAHRKMMQSLERLQAAAAAGSFSREEYRAFRESIVQRFRKAEAAVTPATSAESSAIEQGLTQALYQLEQRAAAGNASRADFQRVRDQLVARARAAANGSNGATTAEAELQGPVHRKLIQSLDRLEVAAQQGTYSREEYSQLRDSMIHRARAIQNPAQPSPVVAGVATEEAGMTQAATDLEHRVDGGQVTAADFQKLRGLIAAKAEAAGAKSDPESAKEALVYQKLMQSLDRLEKAAQTGSVDRQEFQAFKDSFIHRARQIASDSQQSNSSSSSSDQKSSEQTAADRSATGKRSAAPVATPVATPPGAQPLPADKGSAQRAEPARDAGGKGATNDPKPAPQPAPAERPKPAGQEPQTPPPQPPHRPASDSGSGKPGG